MEAIKRNFFLAIVGRPVTCAPSPDVMTHAIDKLKICRPRCHFGANRIVVWHGTSNEFALAGYLAGYLAGSVLPPGGVREPSLKGLPSRAAQSR